MRVIFIGSVIFSSKMLKVVINNKLDIVGIITKKKSNYNSDHFDIAKNIKQKRIPVLYTKNINEKKNI